MVLPAILLINIYPSHLTRHPIHHTLFSVVLAAWVVSAILLIDILPDAS